MLISSKGVNAEERNIALENFLVCLPSLPSILPLSSPPTLSPSFNKNISQIAQCRNNHFGLAKKCWTVSEAFYIQAKESGENAITRSPALFKGQVTEWLRWMLQWSRRAETLEWQAQELKCQVSRYGNHL